MHSNDLWNAETAAGYDTPGKGAFAADVIDPAELDLMAQLAGFVRESRWADFTGVAFTAESPSHVTVYRLPAEPTT